MSGSFQQRRFIMHAAHESVGLTADRPTVAPPLAKPEARRTTLRVCLVTGARDDGWDQSACLLGDYLQHQCRFECRRWTDPLKDKGRALDDLRTTDCLVLLGRPASFESDWFERLKQYCQGNRPVVALRCASQTFADWPGLDHRVFGAEYRGRHTTTQVQIRPAGTASEHPILAGVEPFTAQGYLYKMSRLAWDAKLLLVGAAEGQMEPVAWFRREAGEHVFFTSLGNAEDFRQTSFLRLLGNAIRWVS